MLSDETLVSKSTILCPDSYFKSMWTPLGLCKSKKTLCLSKALLSDRIHIIPQLSKTVILLSM